MISRFCTLAVAAGALACLTSGTAAAQALKPFSLRLDWVTHGMHSPFLLAVDKGLFKAAGLDLKMEDGNGSVVTTQLIGNGQFDIGFANGAVMAMGRDKGLPVKSVTGFVRKSDMGIFVTKSSGIKTVKDFEGKKLIYTNGSLETPFMDALFKAGGTSRDKIQLVAVTAAAKFGTYVNGGGDGVITTIPSYHTQIQEKVASTEIHFADYGLQLPGFGLLTTEDTMKKKPEEIRIFVKVVLDTLAYIMQSDEKAMEAATAMARQRPQANIDVKLMATMIKDFYPYFQTKHTSGKPLGWQTAEDWAETVSSMEASEVLKKGTKPTDYFTNDFIPAPKS